jgi:Fe2+ or Zn2+ uptake regulation protein
VCSRCGKVEDLPNIDAEATRALAENLSRQLDQESLVLVAQKAAQWAAQGSEELAARVAAQIAANAEIQAADAPHAGDIAGYSVDYHKTVFYGYCPKCRDYKENL